MSAAAEPLDAASRILADRLPQQLVLVKGPAAERAAGERDTEQKLAATLQARAALAGYELVRLADGEFIASRWGMFRTLEHVAAVEGFLARVGAPA